MDDIIIAQRGKYQRMSSEFCDGNWTNLLFSDDSFEATIDIIPKGTVGCLYNMPIEDFEFNYILKGHLEMYIDDKKVHMSVGDTFTYYILTRNYMFRILEDVELLCIKKTPCFNYWATSIDRLNEILTDLQAADGDTLAHCERVKGLSMGIAYFTDFDRSKLLDLFYAAKFHDVGKAKIPLEILLKPGKLTVEEFEIMKEHSRYTYDMILEDYGQDVAELAFEHHEKLDGTGYPRKLKGDEISLGGRIICVADAYDAMTVTRPYRNGLSRGEAIAELRRCANTQFDPKVIDALELHLKDIDESTEHAQKMPG